MRAVDPRVMTARMRAVASVDVTDKLKELQLPVLYIASGRDRIIGRRGERQVIAAASHAEVRVLDAPHLVLQTRPRDAAGAVLEFVQTV